MTLTDFLLARIAEDQRFEVSSPYGNVQADYFHLDPEDAREYNAEFRARVLAECEAKRRIVEWVTNAQRYAAEGQPGAFDPEDARALTHALRLLALPYADHPDYLAEWRP